MNRLMTTGMNWEAMKKELQVASTHVKEGKGIICKMLGICLEVTQKDRKERSKRERDLKEEMESRKTSELLLLKTIEQLQ